MKDKYILQWLTRGPFYAIHHNLLTTAKRSFGAHCEAADISATELIAPVALYIRQRGLVDELNRTLDAVINFEEQERYIWHGSMLWTLQWIKRSSIINWVADSFQRFSLPWASPLK